MTYPISLVAVLAFRAAYALETKRRDNDRKILALFAEMKDMMAVLTQYVHICHATDAYYSRSNSLSSIKDPQLSFALAFTFIP